MERQGVTVDKAVGIVNGANLWAIETMHNAKYRLELFSTASPSAANPLKL